MSQETANDTVSLIEPTADTSAERLEVTEKSEENTEEQPQSKDTEEPSVTPENPEETTESENPSTHTDKSSNNPTEPTSALYISPLIRPVAVRMFKSHVLEVSHVPEDSIKAFFVDRLRTHAYIITKTAPEAQDIQKALQNTRYPESEVERPLMDAQFIPLEDAERFVDFEKEHEENAGGFSSLKRWKLEKDESGKLQIVENTEPYPVLPPAAQPNAEIGGERKRKASETSEVDGKDAETGEEFNNRDTNDVKSAKRSRGDSRRRSGDGKYKSTTTLPKIYYCEAK